MSAVHAKAIVPHIERVAATQVLQRLIHVEQLLLRVVTPASGYTMPSLLEDLQAGRALMWAVWDGEPVAVMVGYVQDRPTGRVLWIQFVAGDNMDSWLPALADDGTRFAQESGCVAIEFAGRRGWEKVLSDYNVAGVIMRREF